MITTAQVCRMFDKWEYSGLKPPIEKISESSKLVASFMERFKFMDEAALEYISVRISGGNVWPTFGVIEQMAREYQESNKAYVYIDYFKELAKKAYLENESFEPIAFMRVYEGSNVPKEPVNTILDKLKEFLRPAEYQSCKRPYFYYGYHYKISYKTLIERQDEFIAIVNEYRHAVGAL